MAVCNVRRVLEVLVKAGFELDRQKGPHRTFKGTVNEHIQCVQVSFHRESDDIKPKTLASIIRQSGLAKDLFRR